MVFLTFPLLPLLVFGPLASVVKLLTSIDRRNPVAIWSYSVVVFLSLASLDYGWGFLHTITVPDAGEVCLSSPREGPRGGGFDRVDYGLFPPSAECVWASGGTSDLVPGYVAPLLYALLAGAAVCAVVAAHLARRARRDPWQREGATE
ncbi:hypothetical protein SAMN04487905_109109 [Actinopolyspora xinjiangensis]|uniref:Uncharacterized protein n=1 Tax=Actinopolyspora xinjiangensis TaxID=405564 RepID=A0A1H0VN15_9ACTN|nr:hypothetical protein [Actinopolyspora xinjiangensis]SDP79962.1 hypothetical protein SAMN04487905_109109 [Actinopolyspora xinjiangensis]